MNERAIRKKLQRLRASDDRASMVRNPETGRAEGPESPFARAVLKREKEARAWKT
jgi:hypothetical protein